MKILHVCSNYFPAHGGPQYTMKHLSEKFISTYGYEVEVATTNSLYGPELKIFKKIDKNFEVVNHVKVYRYSFKRWHYGVIQFANRLSKKILKKPLPYSIYKKRIGLDCPGIDKAMKNTDADVIMATTLGYNFCDYVFWRKKIKNPKPIVLYGALHLHINWPYNSPLIKRARACDCYIANTSYEAKVLEEKYNVNSKKIFTIGTGINVADYSVNTDAVAAFRHQNNIADDEILISHIGRLSEGKGVGILLAAFEKLCKTNKKIKLLLCGTKTDYSRTLLKSNKLKNLPIIVIENFAEEEKAIMFNATDIFVLASTGESFGVVFLEAWACKKPVIGANVGAIASLITNENDGFLFEPKDEISLAEKINYLINNNAIRKQLGENGYKKIIDNYTWDIILEKYNKAYQFAINNFLNKQHNV